MSARTYSADLAETLLVGVRSRRVRPECDAAQRFFDGLMAGIEARKKHDAEVDADLAGMSVRLRRLRGESAEQGRRLSREHRAERAAREREEEVLFRREALIGWALENGHEEGARSLVASGFLEPSEGLRVVRELRRLDRGERKLLVHRYLDHVRRVERFRRRPQVRVLVSARRTGCRPRGRTSQRGCRAGPRDKPRPSDDDPPGADLVAARGSR